MRRQFRQRIWPKLRSEWKTFAWGLLGLIVEVYDATAPQIDFPSLFPTEWQPWPGVVILSGMFLLRKWRDDHVLGSHSRSGRQTPWEDTNT